MLDLYITRHGQTVWNMERRFQGRHDSDLTQFGRMQASLLHGRIKDLNLDVIYTSPSKRAWDTTMLLKKDLDIPVYKSEELYEMGFGDWEGRILEEVMEEHAHLYSHLIQTPSKYIPVTGESFEELFNRTNAFIGRIKEQHGGQRVLIVTHGITRKAIMSLFQDKNIDEFWQSENIAKQTSLTHIQITEDGKSKVLMNNDYTHWKHLEEK